MGDLINSTSCGGVTIYSVSGNGEKDSVLWVPIFTLSFSFSLAVHLGLHYEMADEANAESKGVTGST